MARLNKRALFELTEVHLQSGAIGEDIVATCSISFSDGTVVAISSGRKGAPATTQAGRYRDFVLDLHARLAAIGNSSIAFTGGFGEARYKFGIGLMIVVAL
jgi:hypothetical protein